jgi:hypothetical protein
VGKFMTPKETTPSVVLGSHKEGSTHTTNPNPLFFSALKTRFSASEIYVGIIHAENLFDI